MEVTGPIVEGKVNVEEGRVPPPPHPPPPPPPPPPPAVVDESGCPVCVCKKCPPQKGCPPQKECPKCPPQRVCPICQPQRVCPPQKNVLYARKFKEGLRNGRFEVGPDGKKLYFFLGHPDLESDPINLGNLDPTSAAKLKNILTRISKGGRKRRRRTITKRKKISTKKVQTNKKKQRRKTMKNKHKK